ncbi:nucleotide exchange factor GrpE [Aetokthonos hydrillicola Thurmond2011]|uniref:Nucleotide exchange factor GrpE n=1 Tax=Aetokthonos hydrillicola Thurmond2011 TaxID=2712845 RepID=A0AAP5I7Z3_9CYAN|nr:nucleotide exchange factor GrpE [Aetokthonos hydrillicola]MBO3459022.1 nucleotide exchange factor GrpE [Aetokthonos hydrillicola CCALA 1050]MBW4590033.1 nucleotide exchange factor GrpE [Aetokthonos hydrillicola CCALA 1050]MDR9894913.1 nucleotide exchange factor GrpE [Aetokthonos hydrillicola Thurmond2011]
MNDLHQTESVEHTDSPSDLVAQKQEYSNLVQESITSIRQMLSGVSVLVSRLQTDFDAKIKYDDSKERTINLLHQELQDYRNDLNFQHLRPLVMELVSLYDDMSAIASKYGSLCQSQELNCVAGEISAFVQDIEDMVTRHGFEIYQTDSDIFDRTWQNAQKTEKTDNPDLDRHIASRVRKGLRYGERVVRPEIVTVYRYTKNE